MERKPAVAGMFYPGDPAVLSADVDGMLAAAHAERAATLARAEAPIEFAGLRAIIVPHAGYVYSGPMAAKAYNVVAERVAAGEQFDRVVIVGPTHRVPVYGVAYPTAASFATPLGAVPLWPGIGQALAGVADAEPNDLTHQDEHAIEVQLPFLQKVLPGVPVVPLNAGQATGVQVADVVEKLLDDKTLLVISSDLSHYLSYADANEVDAITLGQVLSLAGPLISEQACGATPINGVIELARRHDWFPLLLGFCNSGDTAGDKARVVGYCAVAFYARNQDGVVENVARVSDGNRAGKIDPINLPVQPVGQGGESLAAGALPASAGGVLLAYARDAIDRQLGEAPAEMLPKWGDWAENQLGVFVTLTKDGELRGCIGTLSDDRPLRQSVPANAVNAAIHDPRFPPLTKAELADIDVEVSVLTPAEPVLISDGNGGLRPPHTEAEAASAIVPFVDGIILRDGWRQATFLPQVWEQLPNPVEFLAHLRAKAGLAPRAWHPGIELLRYHVQAFEE